MLFPTYRNTKELFSGKRRVLLHLPRTQKSVAIFSRKEASSFGDEKRRKKKKKKHFRREAKRKTLERKRKFLFPSFEKRHFLLPPIAPSPLWFSCPGAVYWGKGGEGSVMGPFSLPFHFSLIPGGKRGKCSKRKENVSKYLLLEKKKGSMAF